VALALFYSLSMAESEPAGEIAHSELRASHDDRDRVVELLRVSAGDGRLTAEELDERLELAIRSGHVKVREPWGTDGPVLLRIDVTGKVGSGHFLARPPRRTFWEWLTRKPYPSAIAAR